MNTADFALQSYDYDLPKHLIASYPADPKESAKLLVYKRESGEIIHSDFYHLFSFIPKDSSIILNDTRVLKARIYGVRQSSSKSENGGGKREILFHYFCAPMSNDCVCQIKGRIKLEDTIKLENGYFAHIKDELENGYKVVFFTYKDKILSQKEILAMLEHIGHIPLPPYIKRSDENLDSSEYQSVFAKHLGAVAAPTASLHFSREMFAKMQEHFPLYYVTLHIGAGTFASVQSQDIREHRIHSEFLHIDSSTIHSILNAKKILCIGTTAMRSVEYLVRQNLSPNEPHADINAQCDLFLHLGNAPIKTDYLLTNFHLPKSSLLMLVASMVGVAQMKHIYAEAIHKQYRFFSYGDGMLIL